MEKKIIFFDIDGTLLDHRNQVPESTKMALGKLKEQGHLRFVCTGRTKCMLPSEITELEFDGYVYGGGTSVEYGGKRLEFAELHPEQITKAAHILNNYHASFLLEGQDNVYLEEAFVNDDRVYFSKFVKGLGEIAKVIDGYQEVHASKVTLLHPAVGEEKLKEMVAKLSEDFAVIIHEPANGKALTDGLIELLPHGYTKASGIQKAIECLGIPWENTIGVGDSNNDLEMLNYVHTAICMGNGSKKAKALADLVTKPIDQDGIEYAMQELKLI